MECYLTIETRKKDDQDDIFAALEDAYGEPIVIKKVRTPTNKRNAYFWLGANNTIVMFIPDRTSSICFASIDGLLLAETYDVVIPESEESEDVGF